MYYTPILKPILSVFYRINWLGKQTIHTSFREIQNMLYRTVSATLADVQNWKNIEHFSNKIKEIYIFLIYLHVLNSKIIINNKSLY